MNQLSPASVIHWAILEWNKRRNFLLYSMIGVSGASLDYLSFMGLIGLSNQHYLLINAISTSIGITNNFFLNAFLNFKTRDQLLHRYLKFYAVGLLGMLASSILLYITIDCLGLPTWISKLGVIFVVVILQYSLNKRISFRKHQQKPEST